MAAAYAALVSLFNNLELIQTHPRHSFSFENKQIQSLLQIVCFLIDFMETGDYHGGSKEAAEVLERQIACAAHAAEDVVESHVVDQIRAGSTLDGEKRSVFLPDVQKVIEDMELVRRKAIKVQKAPSGFKAEQPTLSAATSSTPLTSSDNDKMVGFGDKLDQLLDLLTRNPSSWRVIPIVGTGGIGKTTLAKNAFKHPLIVHHFDVCLWVTISQQYVVTDILLALLSRHGQSNTKTADELEEELYKTLSVKRYLIVLDDMWSVEVWNTMECLFPKKISGSRIIVTSRQSDVAHHLGSRSLAMSFLKEGESWDLFCEKVFAEPKCPRELEESGKKIVEKCGGLPLAIVVVGGHLRMSPRTQELWENFANSILNSLENDKQLFDILYLSYSHLPVHLKPCFLYMGVFPEDRAISASYLMRLWIAEGFLTPKEGKTLEEVGEGCLNDLIGRNLILVEHRSLKRKSETCVIHDVLRELCLKIAEKEKLFGVLDTLGSMYRVRRVVINSRSDHDHKSAPLLRSQIAWEGCHVSFSSKLLRVAISEEEESFSKDEDFWAYNVNLRLLEYRFQKQGFFNMDSSVSLLWNLQTLIIKGVDSATIAPYEIWEMTQLRHLEVDNVFLPDPLPSDEANDMILRNLQTLEGAVNFRLSDEVCKRISSIKELHMQYSESAKQCDEPWTYCPHNLGRLQKLESLHCSISHVGPEWHEFVQPLTLPSSLKKLSLGGFHLDWEEMTMKIGSLPLVEVLDLSFFKGGEEWNPIEGGFSRLRSLDIRGCRDLRYWNAESLHFPVLEHLSLKGLSKLDELPCGIGEIPTLQRIELIDCSVSLAISALGVVDEQEENWGNDNLQLHVVVWNDKEVESFKEIVQEAGLTTKPLKCTTYSNFDHSNSFF